MALLEGLGGCEGGGGGGFRRDFGWGFGGVDAVVGGGGGDVGGGDGVGSGHAGAEQGVAGELLEGAGVAVAEADQGGEGVGAEEGVVEPGSFDLGQEVWADFGRGEGAEFDEGWAGLGGAEGVEQGVGAGEDAAWFLGDELEEEGGGDTVGVVDQDDAGGGGCRVGAGEQEDGVALEFQGALEGSEEEGLAEAGVAGEDDRGSCFEAGLHGGEGGGPSGVGYGAAGRGQDGEGGGDLEEGW